MHRIDNENLFSSVSDDLRVDGAVLVNQGSVVPGVAFSLPTTAGAAGQMPTLNSNGTMSWSTPSSGISSTITNVDGTNRVTSVAAGTNDNVDITCDGTATATFLPGLLQLYNPTVQPTLELYQLDKTARVGICAPTAGITTYNITVPATPPTSSSQVLTSDSSGNTKWSGNVAVGSGSISTYTSESTGTASQLGTTVTGSGFTPAMVGGEILWAGASAGIVSYTSSTQLTVDISQTVPSAAYSLYYGGSKLNKSGTASSKQVLLKSSIGTLGLYPASSTTSYNLTMPPAVGSANQLLQTDATGVTKWSSSLLPKFVASSTLTLTGTASQTGTTVTGSGFTQAMTGGVIEFLSGQYATVTTFTSATSLQVDTSQTVTSNTFTLYYGGSSLSTGTASSKQMLLNASTTGRVLITPASTTSTYSLTLPAAVATVANRALTSSTAGVLNWQDVALQGGNTLSAALTLGTNDAFGLNLRTNAQTVFALDISGNITAAGTSWSQNGVSMTFATAGSSKTNNTVSAVSSFVIPSNTTLMRAQIWGAGAGWNGGSGAYVDVTLYVSPGETYWLVTGAPGVYPGPGGNAGGGNASGAGGTGISSAPEFASGGGQYSALIRQSGSNYILVAAAGGGGGGNGPAGIGGGGGQNGGGTAGSGGTGGVLANAGSGQNYDVNATTTGVTILNAFGGRGGNGALAPDGGGGFIAGGGGGGGYGGGSGGYGSGGGGGGNYAPPSSNRVLSSAVTVGTSGGTGTAPGSADANYIPGYAVGGGATTVSGGAGLVVITLSDTRQMLVSSDIATEQLKIRRRDGAANIRLKAAVTSADYTLTLPTTAGTAGQVLTSDGSGGLYWS